MDVGCVVYHCLMGQPVIRIFGGVHDDPGSRDRFRIEFVRRVADEGPPHFISVEHDLHMFLQHAAQRPGIARCLRERWKFLSDVDAAEVSAAYFWEGDAHRGLVSGRPTMLLDQYWEQARPILENQAKRGFHGWKTIEDNFVEIAQLQVDRLCNPSLPSRKELKADAENGALIVIPEPRTREELVARITKKAWDDARQPEPNDNSRDARWVRWIEDSLRNFKGGWAGVTVGWRHADAVEAGNLRAQLLERGHEVECIKLAPDPNQMSTAPSNP